MKSFKEHLNESIKTTSFVDFIFTSNELLIPIRELYVKKLLQMTRTGYGVHFTSEQHIGNLIKLEGSKKSISVVTREIPSLEFVNTFSSGVVSVGGMAVLLSGNTLIDMNDDVFTSKDEYGMRWIPARNILISSNPTTKSYRTIEKVFTKLKKIQDDATLELYFNLQRDKDIDFVVAASNYKNGLYHFIVQHEENKYVRKHIAKFITDYNTVAERVIDRFRDEFVELLFQQGTKETRMVGLPETVMNRIKIHEIWSKKPSAIRGTILDTNGMVAYKAYMKWINKNN